MCGGPGCGMGRDEAGRGAAGRGGSTQDEAKRVGRGVTGWRVRV